MIKNILEDRIRYSETDQMGLVHHSNYARFYENGRSKLMRDLGMSYAVMEEMGIVMPVISVESKFIKPLFYDQTYSIETIIHRMPTARLLTSYMIYNDKHQLVHEGKVVLGFMTKPGYKVCRPPKELITIFSKYFTS